MDHITPKASGGTDDEGNLECICTDCHKDKTAEESGHNTHPDWLEPSAIPLTIVCGPPCSGKTTFIRERSSPDDVIIDLDTIRMKLDPTYRHWTGATSSDLMNRSIRQRNAMLGDLARAKQGKAWFIVSAPTKEERKWWADVMGGKVVLLNPGPSECKRRAAARGTPLAIHGIDRWYRRASEPWSSPRMKPVVGVDGWPVRR